jgi:dinuclear metal center YbgI/SA1388 family protein
LKILIESQISLYAVHLPLDAHPLFGNNITLARLISDKTRPFGRDLIGYIAEKECVIEDVVNLLESKLKTSCRAFLFGPERTKKIAVATGGGADLLSEAIKESADTFITGEPRLSAYHLAKENRMNLIFAGHYATEILGIKALLKEVETSFSVECIFFDSHVEI